MRETIEIDKTAYELVEGTYEQPVRLQGVDGVYLVEQWGSPTVLSLVEPSEAWRDARAAEKAARVRRPDVGGFLLAMYEEKVGLGEEVGSAATALTFEVDDSTAALAMSNAAASVTNVGSGIRQSRIRDIAALVIDSSHLLSRPPRHTLPNRQEVYLSEPYRAFDWREAS